MKKIFQYLLSDYNDQSLLVIRKTSTLIVISFVLIFYNCVILFAHSLGNLPGYLFVADIISISVSFISIWLIKKKLYVEASNFVLSFILLAIFIQLPLRDFVLPPEPTTHLHFLETTVLVIASLIAISLCAFKGYQIFFATVFGLIICLAHFFIIVLYLNKGVYKPVVVVDFVIYTMLVVFVGFLCNYMYQINEKLILELQTNVDKFIDLSNNLKIKVEQRAQELEVQNIELKKANFELDKFVYSVSHDLRSPLVSALGLIALMKEETSLNSLLHYMQLLENLMLKLDTLIKDILDLSINSRQPAQNELIDLQKLFDDIFESNKYYHKLRFIDKKIEVFQKVPLYSDRKRLNIIFNNLITNAIKYSREEEHQPIIRVKAYSFNQQVIVEVEDNGEGIGKEHLDKIYDMFFRATTNSHGSGLGLYIVKETLAKLNGNIQVESELGKWTKFTVKIPNNFDSEVSGVMDLEKKLKTDLI
jgi:signal transduction histidine kinase